MPTYEYECRSCGYSFERVQSMSEEAIKECPECGKEVRRVIFGAGIIFKGSGFYVNDSRGKNPAAPATATKTAGTGSDSGSPDSNAGGASAGGTEQKKAPSNAAAGTAAGSPAANASGASGKSASRD